MIIEEFNCIMDGLARKDEGVLAGVILPYGKDRSASRESTAGGERNMVADSC